MPGVESGRTRKEKKHKKHKKEKKHKKRKHHSQERTQRDRRSPEETLKPSDSHYDEDGGKRKRPRSPSAEPAALAQDSTTTAAKRAMMAPMSREQYERIQSQVHEVYDEASGRVRLIKGTGEVIERIVSRAEHAHINQLATRADGAFFQGATRGAR